VFAVRDDGDDEQLTFEDAPVTVDEFLAPLAPPNVFAIGRNYRAHAKETGSEAPEQPLIFCKPTTSVIGPEDRIVLPAGAPSEVDFEAELAIVIGRLARNVPESEALSYVFGYTCANDVSARDCQRNDKQWTRAKGFDTFCPLGPWIVTADALDPNDLRIVSRVNGETMQDARTSEMIHSPAKLVSYVSHQSTLLPGTVILTGTPAGVGMARTPPRFLRQGDEVAVEIEGIGTLINLVVAAEGL
jgi:2-keto-4-pentenoate hydratase/2-oxohepta-3-ene-1,7-dioic acid hydratase in catechol pathway